MSETIAPVVATLCVILLGAAIGLHPMRKLIQIYEAKHELKQGSASFFRSMTGWIVIALWLAAVWFFTTITGDWWATGDLQGAIERSFKRLEILLHILAALADD